MTWTLAAPWALMATPTVAQERPSEDVPVLTVRGQRQADPHQESSAAQAAVPDAVLTQPGATLQQVLQQIPGVRTISDGSATGAASASIRGATGRQTHVYLDGVLVNDALSGQGNLGTLPLEHVDDVRVYRSAVPFGYGPSAIGGAIDISTREPASRHLGIGLEAGSFGSWGGNVTYTGPLTGNTWGLAGLSYTRSEGDFPYLNDQGTAFDTSDDTVERRGNNHSQTLDGLAKVSTWVGQDWKLTLTQGGTHTRGGLPGNGLRQPTSATRSDVRTLTRLDAANPNLGERRTRLVTGIFFTHTGQQQYDPFQEFGTEPNDTHHRTWQVGGSALGDRRVARWLRLGESLRVDQTWFNPSDALVAGPAMPDSKRTRSTLGLRPRVNIDVAQLDLSGVVNATHVFSDVERSRGFGGVIQEGPAVNRLHLDWRVGAVWHALAVLDLKANYSVANREPTFLELFGDSAFVLPASGSLQPERGQTFDAGVSVRINDRPRGAVQLDAFGFLSTVDDLIHFVRSTSDTFVADNFDRAILNGVELALAWDLFNLLAGSAAYDFLTTELESASPARNGRELPLRSRHQLSGRLEAYRRDLWKLNRLSFTTDLDAQSGNYVDASNVIRVPGRVRLNLGARADLLDERLTLQVVVRNLTDNRTNDLINYPLPGRHVAATLGYRIL